MRSLRGLGCALGVTLLLLVGVAVWVGIRIGAATVGGRADAPTDSAPSLLGRPRLLAPLVGRGHGAVGLVETIEGDSLTLTTRDGEPQVIRVTSDTLLLEGPRGTSVSTRVGSATLDQFPALRPGVALLIIGRPQAAGYIEARIIHILPSDLPDRPRNRLPLPPPSDRWRQP